MSEGKQLALGIFILIAIWFGCYIYQDGPAQDADKWIPLFKTLIPIAFISGVPIILAIVVVFLVKSIATGATIAKQIIVGQEAVVQKDDEEEAYIPIKYSSIVDMNKRHTVRKRSRK